MEGLRDHDGRAIVADPNFNFFSIGDGQREGSLALSDISFPSHVSELESFQSDLDITLLSRDSISTQGELEPEPDGESEIGGHEPFTQHQEGVDSTKCSTLPDLPDQASENIDLLLAAFKAATVQENVSDQASDENKSESGDISNQDSSRFISKESFPDSIFSGNESSESVSWRKDNIPLIPGPEDLVNQLSSTPFCGKKITAAVKLDSDSRMSEKFLAPSSTPGTDPSDLCPQSTTRNTWSFSGNSMLCQTTVSEENTFNQAKGEQSSKPNTTAKEEEDESLFTSPIQKKLWPDTPDRTSTFDNTFQKKDGTAVGFESETAKEGVFNPFDDDFMSISSNALEDKQNLFDDEGLSFGQELQEEFSFQSADAAALRLDKDEEMFEKDVVDVSMFSDYVFPDGTRKTRRSLPVIAISDPNDKGELRISIGDFFAAKTEELGKLGDRDENCPRPQFSGTRVNVSPAAAAPRLLYRPSPPEGSENETLHRQSYKNSRSEQLKPRKAGRQSTDSQRHGTSPMNLAQISSPSAAEDKDEVMQKREESEKVERGMEKEKQKWEKEKEKEKRKKEKEKEKEKEREKETEKEKRRKEKEKEREKEKEKQKREEEKEKERPDGGNGTRSVSLDPNSSTIAALKFCHSSQGPKLLGMSTNALKSLSSTLAKVTQGDALEIYKVLVDFICEKRRLSQTSSDLDGDSRRISEILDSKKKESNDSTVIDRTLSAAIPEEPVEMDGMTFYHSDTSCEVSPTVSKFERLTTSIPSPPLDSSSPKSTASSIAIQTESQGGYSAQASTASYRTTVTTTVGPRIFTGTGTSLSKTTGDYHLVNTGVQLPEGLTNVGHQTNSPLTGVVSSTLGAASGYPAKMSSLVSVPALGLSAAVFKPIQTHPALSGGRPGTATMGMPAELAATTDQMNLAATTGRTYVTPTGSSYSHATSSSAARMLYPPPTSQASAHGEAWQSIPKGRTIPGSHSMFYGRPQSVSKSLQPRPRSACDTHGFFASQAAGERLGSVAAVGEAVAGCDRDQEVTQFNRVHVWGGDDGAGANQVGHRQVWNWRTEHTSQIQMVIPPVLDFPGVLCVGMSAEALLPIHNPTSRWIRCSSVIVSSTVNGIKGDHMCECPFSIRETTLIGPKLTENVKVEFLCLVAGIYVAEMKVVSTPVGSLASDNETSSAVVTVQGFSEEPQLEILADDGQTLDFGELHHGCNIVRPLRIVNKGRTAIPLKMLICSSSSPGIFIFSKNNSPDVIQNLQVKSTALKCLLPVTNDLDLKPESMMIWIEMVGKNHRFEKSSQAEIFSAGINIQLDVRAVPKILGNVPLKGIIGFTEIQIPKAFQMAMCLSSSVGKKVSRKLPFSNAGSISANVELTIPKYSDVFIAAPNKFQIQPGTEVIVEVAFSPHVKGSYESVIQVSELGGSKSYEVLLRGSSVETQTTAMDDKPPILSDKSCLCWTGVDIGKAAHQRLFLLNDSLERSTHFQALIQGEHADFAIQRMKSNFSSEGNSSEPMSLRPKEKVPVYVLFAPSSLGVFKSALVLKPDCGPRLQVPLYAYGGTSEISICDHSKTSDGYVADLGQVSLGHRNILKITLKNSGSRAAFVKAVCYSDFQIRLLYRQTHLSIVPSAFILPERSSKELVIVYQPLQHDAKACQSQVKRVATVVFYCGDEVLRQWYKRILIGQHDYEGRHSIENSKLDDLGLDKVFQDENCVAEEFDFPAVENWNEIFTSHLSQVSLNVLGGPGRSANLTSTADDDGSTPVTATSSVPAQKESALEKNMVKKNQDSDKLTMWSIIPEQLSLKVPIEGSTDATKKVQLLNFSDRPLEFEFIWPGHCIAVTPHRGSIPPKNQVLVHVSVWASISRSGIELPWSGTAYVNCDGTKKELAIQIHRHLVCEGSPTPVMINKPLTVLDPERDKSLLQTYTKTQKHSPPLTVTPKIIEFPETEVGKVSASTVTVANVATSLVRWKVSSVAPAYAKVPRSMDIFRAMYPVFRFSSLGGLMRAGQTIKIEVEFQPRDPGDYCQTWDIQTNPESPLTSTKIQMGLSGKAVTQKESSGIPAAKKSKVRVSDPVCEREPVVAPSVPGSQDMPSKQNTGTTKQRNMTINFEPDNVQFPDTAVGETSVVKVKICNRSSTAHKIAVVNPRPPFSVKLSNIHTIKPGRFLRIPVHFSPKEPSEHYEETVFLSYSISDAMLSLRMQGNSVPAK